MNKYIDIYYFSGTGNTLLAVKKMKEVFEKLGYSTSLKRIEIADPSKIDPSHTIGLAFPVTAFSTFPFVWGFIKALPEVHGTEAFMLDTFGGTSGAVTGPLRTTLNRKGFKTIGAKEILMPPNIFYIYGEEKNKAMIENGLKTAESFAHELIENKSPWKSISILSVLMNLIAKVLLLSWKIKWGQKYFSYRLKKERCTKCGICARICPVGNIEMKEFPTYKLKCQYCLRCASFCPEHALMIPFNYRNKTYRSVELKEISQQWT